MKKPVSEETRKKVLLRIVETQIAQNDPPETVETLDRLISQGKSRDEALQLIAVIVGMELVDMFNEKSPFDRDRFVARLDDLPRLPKI